jgi:hypothetical protein
MTTTHIAALFPTGNAAHAARDQLVAAGIDAARILVLDRGHGETEAQPRAHRGFWDTVKQFLVPDDDARHYADAIVRGHPLLIADVTETEREIAMSILRAAAPISLEAHDGAAQAGAPGQTAEDEPWARSRRNDRAAASSEGIIGGGVIAGD